MNTQAVISLPFPDPRLSPNRRRQHRWNTDIRSRARSSGFWAAKESGIQIPDRTPLHLFITFCPPDNRKRDLDNLLSSSKSSLDGIFQALGVDDCNVRRTTLEIGNRIKGGATLIQIELIGATA